MPPDDPTIRAFLRELDAFLLLQFDVLAGEAAREGVAGALASLVEHARRGRDASADPAPWERWRASLESAEVQLVGFPNLRRDLIADQAWMAQQQRRLRQDPRAGTVRARLDFDVEALLSAPVFATLHAAGPDGLEENDVALSTAADPTAVADRLLGLDGKARHVDALEFRSTSSARPFMARLYTEPRAVIGHPPVTTLFRLSGLAHEVGHASSLDLESCPEERFAAPFADEDATEVDAYRYERLLAEQVEVVAGPLVDDHAAARELLFRRKALQAFGHVVACRLAGLFFAGHPPDAIAAAHAALLRRHLPSHPAGDWRDATDLARPLARLAYVHAYVRAFL